MATYNVAIRGGGPGETVAVEVEVIDDGDGDEFLSVRVPDGYVLEEGWGDGVIYFGQEVAE